MLSEPEIVVGRVGSLARILLMRPKALNALTIDMIREMTQRLAELARDDSARIVLIEGAGDRALCAGGDIRALHDDLASGGNFRETFWREEYALNALIARYPKPYVALMDGIVMGGGVGISAHGSHRIVTERTRLAMPEVGLGFIPDVGASWLLSRAPGELGTFLALSGDTIGAADAMACGLADYFVRSAALADFAWGLAELPEAGDEAAAVRAAIAAHSADPGPSLLAEHRDAIDDAFAHDRVEAILAAADASPDPFVVAAGKRVATRSPLALKVTLAMLRRACELPTVEDCLAMEFRIGERLAPAGDFHEGIRAAVIDKDSKPRWRPSTLAEVSDAQVEGCFAPLGKPELWAG